MGLLASLIQGLVSGIWIGRAAGKQIPEADRYLRLAYSISLSSFISFGAVFSAAGLAALAAGEPFWQALGIALFSGAGAAAAAVLNLAKRSELLKGIPLWVVRGAEEGALAADGTYSERE